MQVMTTEEIAARLGGRRGRMGATMMEYVIIAVLIAAACLVGVIVYNRVIVRNTDVMGKGITGRGSRAGEAAEIYRSDTEADVKEAEKFPNEFSDIKN
jgi:Flp pilus assembly pilin Flp